RPLISFVTSLRPYAGGQIAPDGVPEFIRQIAAIGKEHRQVDVLLVSYGGDSTVAWRMVSLLRERFDHIAVLLPYTAYSAATLVALGANSIVMHPFANLGPVDPQIPMTKSYDGQEPVVTYFGYEDLVHFLGFVREEVGITDQQELGRAFELLSKDVGAIPIGSAKRSSQLSLSLGAKLLGLHMEDKDEARAIAEALNKAFFHHGYPVGRHEARQIKLPIEDPPAELEELLWRVWLSLEEEMACNVPFNPLEIVLSNPEAAAALSHVQQVQMPANLPPHVADQVYNNVLQKSVGVTQVPTARFELFQATIESTRGRSEFRSDGIINVTRLPNMTYSIAVNTISSRWTFHSDSATMTGNSEH
ncbi:MAG: hypothetical protein AB1791_21040, partial [Chloroflexota bacterium]